MLRQTQLLCLHMARRPEQKALDAYLDSKKLKHTRQRDAILDAFLGATGHITGDELFRIVRARHPRIGFTTVYRTLKLFCEAGLAEERHFADGVTRFEIKQEHHDHLVCTKCGKIVEFECTMIEQAQNDIASRYDFQLLRHRYELYGLCRACRS